MIKVSHSQFEVFVVFCRLNHDHGGLNEGFSRVCRCEDKKIRDYGSGTRLLVILIWVWFVVSDLGLYERE